MISDLLPPVALRRDLASAIALSFGVRVTMTSGWRSSAKQQQLREQYEGCLARGESIYPGNPDSRCRYPANRAGDSSHEYGLSFDSSVPEESWPLWTAIRRAVGFVVPDNDRVHAEIPNWRAVAQELYRYGYVPLPPLGAQPSSSQGIPTIPQLAPAPAPAPSSTPTYPYSYQGYGYRCVGTSAVWESGTPLSVVLGTPGACKYKSL